MYNRERARALNDAFRTSLKGGQVVITPGVEAYGSLGILIYELLTYSDFNEDNDPYGEHDFGAFEHDGERFFWKIDYYDPSLNGGSIDPANEAVTTRVLTLMLASEY